VDHERTVPADRVRGEAVDPDDDFLLGVTRDTRVGATVQGRYRVLKKIGEGGMGAVYEGEHLLIKRRVAIKTLHPHLSRNPDVVARFRREALAATATRNEHVVEVTDMGQFDDDGALYLVLEFLDGRNLSEEMAGVGPMPLGRAARILFDVCDALEVLHAQGIVHRDLKPENLFLIKRGSNPDFVKILDFGISKLKVPRDGGPTHLTEEGMLLGTARFMSPEQANGDRDVDHRTDIYALGGILYNMLTGSFPFEAETLPMLFVKLHTESPPPIELRRSDLPPVVGEIVARCLAKRKEDRIQSVAELRAYLGPLRDVDVAPSLLPDGFVDRRRRLRWMIGGAVGLALTAALFTKLARPRESGPPPALAAMVALPTRTVATVVRVRIWTTPASAELYLDGEPIPNPFDDTRTTNTEEHTVEARLAGFTAAHRRARFDAPLNLRLELVAADAPIKPEPRPARGRRPTAVEAATASELQAPVQAEAVPPVSAPAPSQQQVESPAAPRNRLLGERQLRPVPL
jgi:tRNA A-37 threonylcarbamoyl transferase component Bud32